MISLVYKGPGPFTQLKKKGEHEETPGFQNHDFAVYTRGFRIMILLCFALSGFALFVGQGSAARRCIVRSRSGIWWWARGTG
jgi:hypothetical protein